MLVLTRFELCLFKDRVFPHLQRLLSAANDESGSDPNEILLAKSASIKDVCLHR